MKTLKVGELYASKKPAVITTVLGSCVAVCLYDTVLKIGGMNHIFLPKPLKSDFHLLASSIYGINAMEYLLKRMIKLGGKKQRLIAKAFGGSNLIYSFSHASGVGERNIEFIKSYLEKEHIILVNESLGGNQGRKIIFNTETGEVFLKHLSNVKALSIINSLIPSQLVKNECQTLKG